MQKKILLSLLIASPTALPALADINFGHGEWDLTGMEGKDYNFDASTGSLTSCGLAGGKLVQNTVSLMPGKYQVTFTKAENVNVAVLQNGAQLEVTSESDVAYGFEVKTAGSVTIEINGKTAEPFTFDNVSLKLDFDFAAAGTALQKQLDALPNLSQFVFENIPATLDKGVAAKLTERENTLIDQRAGYTAVWNELMSVINQLKGCKDIDSSDAAALAKYEKLYLDNKLYEDPSALAQRITEFGADKEEWMEAAEQLNQDIVNTVANTDTRNALLAEEGEIMAGVDKLLADIETVCENNEGLNLTNNAAIKELTANVNALKGKVQAYENQINDAYAKDKLAGEIAFDGTETVKALKEELAKLNKDWTGCQSDLTAYTTFMNVVVPDLDNALAEAEAAIKAFSGLTPYESNFDTDKAAALKAVKTIFDGARDALKIEDIAGAAALLAGDQKTVADAKTDMQTAIDGLATLVNGQNTQFDNANKAIQALNADYGCCKLEVVPPAIKEQYAELSADIEAAIEALQNKVNGDYVAKNLDFGKAEYTQAVQDIQNDIDELAKLVGPAATINRLNGQLVVLDADIKNMSTEINNAEGGVVDFYGLFGNPEGSLDSIKKAIADLTVENVEASKGDIEDALKQTRTNAETLFNQYLALIAADKAYAQDGKDLKNFVEDKIELDAEGNPTTTLKDAFMSTGDGAKFISDMNAFHSELLALDDKGTPQEVFGAVKEMYESNGLDKVDPNAPEYSWQLDLQFIEDNFAKFVTSTADVAKGDIADSNFIDLLNFVKNIKDDVDQSEFVGKNKIDFTAIDKVVNDINTSLSTAKTIKEFATADGAIVKAFVDAKALVKTINAYKDNQKVYDKLLGQLTPAKQADIDNLIAQNEEQSKDEGKAYFDNVINGKDNPDSLQAWLDDLEKQLAAALAKGLVTDVDGKTEVGFLAAHEQAYQDMIDALGAGIKNTADKISAVNLAHNNQLLESQHVYDEIDDALALLEETYNKQTEIAGWYEGLKKQLEDLRDIDMYEANLAVAVAYANGKSADENAALMKKYSDIRTKISNIEKQIRDEYANQVVASNMGIVEAAGWNATKKAMNDKYMLAVQEFNNYYYGLENPGWRAAVLPVVKRHLAIYDYSQEILDLIAEVNKFIKDANAVPETFSAAEFQAVATDKADALIAGMQAKMDALNAEAAVVAEAYYNKLSGDAQSMIAEYQSKLNNAGIYPNYFKAQLNKLNDIANQYEDAVDPLEAIRPLGLAMDPIADELDEVLEYLNGIDLQAMAETAWANAYGPVDKNVAAILAALQNTETEAYKFADPELRAANTKAIAEKQAELKALNAEVAAVEEDLIDSYKGYSDRLNALKNEINALDKAVKTSSANNKYNQEEYKNLTGTVIPGFETDLQALIDYADTLAGGRVYDTDAIQNKIDALKQYVEQNAANLFSNSVKNQISSKKSDIANTISNAYCKNYGSVAYYEQQYLLTELIPLVKEAFNDAKVAFMGGLMSNLDKETGLATINGWNTTIDGYETEAQNLSSLFGPEANKTKFQTAAQALEQALADLYVTMEMSWTSDKHPGVDPIIDVKAQLQNQYDEVAAAIQAANTYLAPCTESLDTTGYAAALAAAEKELQAQKTAWEAAGNRVLTMQQTYQDNMSAVAEDVEQTMTDMQAANEKHIANDQAYTKLNAELAALKAELDRVSAMAEDWYPGYYTNQLAGYAEDIADAQEDLDKRNAAVELTADSTLTGVDGLADNISDLEMVILRRQANDQRINAKNALYSVTEALRANIIPEERTVIEDAQNQLQTEYDENGKRMSGYTEEPITPALLNEVIDEYERIKAEADKLRADAVENSYVLGDVDLNPDGLVTSNDVQMMIQWVLQGMTWQQLYDENRRQAYAADINGDKVLNITDVSMDISLVFGENPTERRLGRFAAPALNGSESMNIELVSEENGVRRYAVMLNNTVDMIAGQMDIKLPAGMSVRDVTVGERAESHSLETMEHGFDTLRVVLYSMENASIDGNSGAVVYVDVEGKGTLKAENVIFTDTYFNSHEMNGSETTGVNSLLDGAKNMGTRIYNAAGVMFNKLQNGINIFRTSDGKVKKEYHRNK